MKSLPHHVERWDNPELLFLRFQVSERGLVTVGSSTRDKIYTVTDGMQVVKAEVLNMCFGRDVITVLAPFPALKTR